MEYEIYHSDELTHWGIKGMRWGVRRYQNKDGTLTAAGKKRLARETEKANKEAAVLKNRKATQAKLDKLEAKKKANAELKKELDGDKEAAKQAKKAEKKARKEAAKRAENIAKKDIKDLTDEELREKIGRLQTEKLLMDTERQIAAMTPQKENKAKQFVTDFIERSAVPALQQAGQSLIRDTLLKKGKELLKLEELDEMGMLRKQADKLDLQNRIKNAKKSLEGKSKEDEEYEDLVKEVNKLNLQTQKKKYEDTLAGKEDPLEALTREKNIAVAMNVRDKALREMAARNKTQTNPAPQNTPETDTPSSNPVSTTPTSSSKTTSTTTHKVTPKATTAANNAEQMRKQAEAQQKRVDRLLEQMDITGWDIYNYNQKQSSGGTTKVKVTTKRQKRVDRLLEQMDNAGWGEYYWLEAKK